MELTKSQVILPIYHKNDFFMLNVLQVKRKEMQ